MIDHNNMWTHQGLEKSDLQTTKNRAIHDLRVRADDPGAPFFSPGIHEEINPMNMAMDSANRIIVVSDPYARRMVQNRHDPGLVGQLGPTIDRRQKDIVGIPNGLDQFSLQKKFLKKMLDDEDVRARIQHDLDRADW